jgi:hypothetical protein
MLFSDMARPVIIDGIVDVIARDDLRDRTLPVSLPRLTCVRTERGLWENFQLFLPHILGALFDCVSASLRNLSSVETVDLPRMADAFVWVSAALPVMGFQPDLLREMLRDSKADAAEAAIEGSPIAGVLISYIHAHRTFEGSVTELLNALRFFVGGDDCSDLRSWPVTGQQLRRQLDRLAPALREKGLVMTFKRQPGARLVQIRLGEGV